MRTQGLKCDFKVVGTVKVNGPPVKICGLISILQRAPCIFSQAVILTNRLTIIHWKISVPMDKTFIFGLEACVFPVKSALLGLGTSNCRNGGSWNGVPVRSSHPLQPLCLSTGCDAEEPV